MDSKVFIIVLSAGVALALGMGVALAFFVLPANRRSRRDLKRWAGTPDAALREQLAEDERERKLLAFPSGRRRNSSVCGLITNVLRHRDGGYTKGYKLRLANSVFDEDAVVENRTDELGRLIAGNYPPGTTFQFRLNVSPDPGYAIRRHIDSRSPRDTHPLAGLLHASSVGFYEEAAARGVFRDLMLSMWVRVPAKHSHDVTGIAALIPYVGREVSRRGVFGFIKSLASAWRRASDKVVVVRNRDDERETMNDASRVFRAVEAQAPQDLGLEEMSREELWDALYRSHRQNAATSPILPETPGLDVRDYTCAETIQGKGWFLLHGSHPVAVVSAFVPPQPFITADSMRKLTANPALNCRHVVLAEFVCLDEKKAKAKLEASIRQAQLTGNTFFGKRELKEDAKARIGDLKLLLQHVEQGRETILEGRFQVVVYGERVRNREELEVAIDKLDRDCGTLVAAIKKIPGADAEREEPAALRAMYMRSLVGEFDHQPTGREHPEVGNSLAGLIPTEAAWAGSPRARTLFATPSGQMTGVDLYDRSRVKSPTVILTAAAGEGKSVTGGRIITDCMDGIAHLKVSAVDNGGSLRPLCEMLGGRQVRYDTPDAPSLNPWYFPGLFDGESPDRIQLAFVEGDIRILAGIPKDDAITKSVITTIVEEVYKIAVARNAPTLPDFEPTLSNFLNILQRYQWKEAAARDSAERLFLRLKRFKKDPLLDAPTHERLKSETAFNLFELDSLSALDEAVQGSIAYRIAAEVMRCIGDRMPDGTYRPVLLVFDEMKDIIKRYPAILEVIEHATRMGRKEGVVTLLMSQAYEDFTGTLTEPNPIGIALAKNSGVKLIGKQIGPFDSLVRDCQLSPEAAGAISAIKNIPGRQSQWLLVIGSGTDKVVELVQVNLSPTEYWTYTTDTNERNARLIVQSNKPTWPMAVIVAALAERYPTGLTGAGLTHIDLEEVVGERIAA
ncbi:MAG: VirB4 family type IV secretion system protein [Pyrinomonadaceae bacterium]